MKIAGIYKFVTTKARGHEARVKYHVYIGSEKGKSVFLFINSENYFGEGFEIRRVDYSFFSKPKSFIGCTGVVSYLSSEIRHLTPESFLGVLSQNDIIMLIKHIECSEVMEPRTINYIGKRLKSILA